jgi:hypothetical protein
VIGSYSSPQDYWGMFYLEMQNLSLQNLAKPQPDFVGYTPLSHQAMNSK